MMIRLFVPMFFVCLAFVSPRSVLAGPYANVGIASTSSDIGAWADVVVDYSSSPGVSPSFSNASNALGAADNQIVSLGDLDAAAIAAKTAPGSITLSFQNRIANGTGWDFAVFENAGKLFTPPFIFAELAYVEVSSNGSDFARFPSTSLNTVGAGDSDTDINVGFGRGFAGINTTNVKNLAGIHAPKTGTAFDLDDLLSNPLVAENKLDLNNISHVRVVDIPGDGSFEDSEGRSIYDAWTTTGSGGHDLDAIGVRYQAVPEPSGMMLMLLSLLSLLRLRRLPRCIGPSNRVESLGQCQMPT